MHSDRKNPKRDPCVAGNMYVLADIFTKRDHSASSSTKAIANLYNFAFLAQLPREMILIFRVFYRNIQRGSGSLVSPS